MGEMGFVGSAVGRFGQRGRAAGVEEVRDRRRWGCYCRGTGRRASLVRRMITADDGNQNGGAVDSTSASAQQASTSGLNEPAAKFFSELPVKKLFTWILFLWGIYLMRSFFPVALGTFIVGYIGNSFVNYFSEKAQGRVARRGIVAAYYSLIISIVTLLGVTTIPTALQSSNPYVFVADGIRSSLGDDVSGKIEKFLISNQGGKTEAKNLPVSDDSHWTEERSRRFGGLIQGNLRPYAITTASVVSRLLGQTTKVLFTAVLSLIFSAMIVWDLPRIGKAVGGLARSRFRESYFEVAPYVRDFFTVLGKSFEAQSMIALVNTSLSTLGIIVLGLKGVWFLSVVVLVCSFIPVAGVIASTLPMVIVALTEYGTNKAIWVVVMVIGVHAVEAYFLNPQIYSAHLKLHPLFVLVVLYMWEHLYGPAGLILGVPVTVYLLRNVVMGDTSHNNSKRQLEEGTQVATLQEVADQK